MSSLIAWILRAIPFGTIIMYGALGEIVTEKSGNLNLGVPGIMYLGGFAGFASSYYYEKTAENPQGWICILIALFAAIVASMLGGLIFSFLTITLRANQNVTGLALTTFGCGKLFRRIHPEWSQLYGSTAGICFIFQEDPFPFLKVRGDQQDRIFLRISGLCGDYHCDCSALCAE